ncbi:PhoH family protein [bacterium]|nr:PhoH family protein [bacterium]MBQ6436015.1 PhoH family protein [bacterium]
MSKKITSQELNADWVVSVIGPTGSGKTELAVKLAQQWLAQGEQVAVISLDTRQCWRELPLLSVADAAGWEHLMQLFGKQNLQVYNLASVPLNSNWSFGTLLAAAREQLQTAQAAGHRIITVGGALICQQRLLWQENDVTSVPPDDNVRFAAEAMNVEQLQSWLRRVDLATWEQMNHSDQCNPRRLVRKIEIALAKKMGIVDQKQEKIPVNQVFLLPERAKKLEETKIAARVLQRWQDVAVRQEVIKVMAKFKDWASNEQLQSQLPLGFMQLASWLQYQKQEITPFLATLWQNQAQELSFNAQQVEQLLLNDWQKKEWHYAKRQMTLLRQILADSQTYLIDEREISAH